MTLKTNIFLGVSKAVLSSVIFLVMLELGARAWLDHFASETQYYRYSLYYETHPQTRKVSPHQYLNYYPTPNYKRGKKTHNSLGYRGDEFEIKKPEGVFRIVAIGGSTTYTARVEDNDKTFPSQLEKVLKNRYGYSHVKVINAGLGGYSSWESLINLEFRVLDLEPDLIIIYHGTNDVHTRLVNPSFYVGDNSGRRKQWYVDIKLWEYSCFFRIISRRLHITRQVKLGDVVTAPTTWRRPIEASGYNELLGGTPMATLKKNPPIYFQRNLINMIAIAKAHGIKVVFATWAYSAAFNDYASTQHYQQGYKENNEVVKAVAESQQIPLFDFASIMSKEKKYWGDGRHLNEKGAVLKAALFADFIKRNNLIE